MAIPLERRSDRWLSVALSVLFHGALLVLIGLGWWRFHRPAPAVPQLAIDATVVDGRALARAQAAQHPAPQTTPPPPAAQTVVPPAPTLTAPEQTGPPAPPKPTAEEQAQAERIAREQAEQKAQAEAQRQADARHQEQVAREQKREAEREAKRQQEAEAKRVQKAAEAKRVAEQKAAAQKAAEDKRRAEAAALAESEADLRRGIDAEQRAMAASGAAATWKQQIEAKLRQSWIRPPTAHEGIDCVLNVTQAPGGEVVKATVGSCNGDTAVAQSIIDAAYRASPLPPPPDPSLFQRELIIHFTPTD